MRRISYRTLLLASACLLLAGTPAAFAQSNEITILQKGNNNSLTVDQSLARESAVGGLTISRPETQTYYRETTETIEVQDAGEPVSTEQRLKIISETVQVVDFSLPNGEPALQDGINNRAFVTITGDGGFVGLLQNNNGLGTEGNFAKVSLNGNGQAVVGQQGDGNSARLRVSGLDAMGSILQQGSGNAAGLKVDGDSAFGSVSQVGNNNESTLAVQGYTGSSVSYTLNGNNVTSFNPTQGVEVFTNAQNVTITQTAITGR